MRKVYMESASRDYRQEWEDNKQGAVIHYEGCAIISNQTLCGYVDLVGVKWTETNKRVNCSGCLAVQKHVMGK